MTGPQLLNRLRPDLTRDPQILHTRIEMMQASRLVSKRKVKPKVTKEPGKIHVIGVRSDGYVSALCDSTIVREGKKRTPRIKAREKCTTKDRAELCQKCEALYEAGKA